MYKSDHPNWKPVWKHEFVSKKILMVNIAATWWALSMIKDEKIISLTFVYSQKRHGKFVKQFALCKSQFISKLMKT